MINDSDTAQGFLNSLLFKEIKSRQYDITTASETTVCWLLKDHIYTAWQHSPKGLLWIRGKPGSGKSTLIKFAVERELVAQESARFVLVYFFFDARGTELQRSPLGFFRVFLYQLVSQVDSLFPIFMGHCRFKKASQKEFGKQLAWTLNELRDLALSYVRQAMKVFHLKIYVDALDECGQASAVEMASYLHALIPQSSTGECIHICISCRHYPIIEPFATWQIIMEEKNNEAIALHIDTTFKTLPATSGSNEITTIEQEIIDRASGVFQWVVLILRIVTALRNNGQHPRLIHKRMKELPTGLNDLYSNILNDINISDRYRALRLMRWVCFAERPLSLSEMRYAIAFDTESPHSSLQSWQKSENFVESDEQMRLLVTSLSGGLVESVVFNDDEPYERTSRFKRNWPGSFKVQFIHESVNDYVRSNGLSAIGSYSAFDIVGNSHSQMWKACVNYFKTEEIRKLADRIEGEHLPWGRKSKYLDLKPFLEYALVYWWQHLRQAEDEVGSQDDVVVWLEFPSEIIFRTATALARTFHLTSTPAATENVVLFDKSPLLHAMCMLDIGSVVRTLIERYEVLTNLKDHMGDTPLVIAIKYKHEALVKYLLSRTNIDVNSQNYTGRTALHIAIKNQQTATVELLTSLGSKILVNLEDDAGIMPLHEAAQCYGLSGVAMMRMLLNHQEIDVNAKDKKGWTALMFAVKWGNEPVVRLLLTQEKIDINSSSKGVTAVHLAVSEAQATILKRLLDQPKINVNGKNHRGFSPLLIAAMKLDTRLVRSLIRHNAVDVNLRDPNGQTALHHMVRFGSEEKLNWLLAHAEVDVNVTDDRGCTPLITAAHQKSPEMISMLLSHTAIDVNMQDINGETALHLLASIGMEKQVSSLLSRADINVQIRNSQGMTALQESVKAKSMSMTINEMLLRAGTARHAPGEYFQEAFDLALRMRRTAILRLMLEKYPHISRRRARTKSPRIALRGWRGDSTVMTEGGDIAGGGDNASDGDLASGDDTASEGETTNEDNASHESGAGTGTVIDRGDASSKSDKETVDNDSDEMSRSSDNISSSDDGANNDETFGMMEERLSREIREFAEAQYRFDTGASGVPPRRRWVTYDCD